MFGCPPMSAKDFKKSIDSRFGPAMMSTMKVYPNVNVSLTYQNFGSSFLCVLRGTTEDIESVFNGLYNFGATNGGLDYYDHSKTVAVFWTDYRALRKFFFDRRFIAHFPLDEKPVLSNVRPYMQEALKYMGELADNHEFFMRFADDYMPDVHNVGKVSAERPDNDMKDAIIGHAYRDRTGEKAA